MSSHPNMPITELVRSVLEELGPDAVAAYEGTGPNLEVDPSAMADGVLPDDVWYEWCDDCSTFHESWVEYGWIVCEGTLEMVVWVRDQDGDWEVADSHVLDTKADDLIEAYHRYEDWRAPYAIEEQERLYREYLEYVSDKGEDPCHEFLVPSEKKTETWQFNVRDASFKQDGVAFISCREVGPHVNVVEVLIGHEAVPSYVREFLILTEVEPHGTLIAPNDYRDVDSMRCSCVEARDWKLHEGKKRPHWQFTVDIERIIRPEGDDLAQYLREKAAEALATA